MLTKLKNILKKNIDEKTYNYIIPDLWNAWGFPAKGALQQVHPYRFYHDVITEYILPKARPGIDYTKPLAKEGCGGDWIRQSTIYSLMVRTSTSWDHDASGELESANEDGFKETGTFVKTLALLPLLKKMGVDVLYLLPISKFSTRDKKGDLGSPYAVQNFFELDPSLKDPITANEMTIEEEFAALVEACHILGIRVVFDIIPRTNAIDSDLIKKHPNWFYWIGEEDLKNYAPPKVPTLGSTLPPRKKYLSDIYKSPEVWEHLRKFRTAPNLSEPVKWQKLVDSAPADFPEAIKKEFGLVIAPAFSDHINDIQPPWSDVTFFRLFLDHPSDSQIHLKGANLPPYILFDTIKANIHEGRLPNWRLWNVLADIMPYFQNQFGIDGARIDMGHALPKDLVSLLITRSRKVDPDFALIAEELDPANAEKAIKNGYNVIIGDGFMKEPRVAEYKTHEFMYGAASLHCPVFACGETHDTPRLAARPGGRTLSRMLTVMNMFVPGGIPFINSGQEVYEIQPMNMGLDCYEGEDLRLPKDDPFYGKLALFDRFAFHYQNKDRWELPDLLDAASRIRKSDLETFTNLDNALLLGFDSPKDPAIAFGYIQNRRKGWQNDNLYLIAASTSMDIPITVRVNLSEARKKSGNSWHQGQLLLSTHEPVRQIREFDDRGDLHLYLQPGEVKIIKI